MTKADQYDLQRFVAAQDASDTCPRALRELRAGRKTSHWMWFVFPQLAGLGRSAMAQRYAISSAPEARGYLAHSVLGPRLTECTQAVATHHDRSAVDIFGSVDAIKLRSSMTLFHWAEPDRPLFNEVLERFFDGEPDPATVRLVQG